MPSIHQRTVVFADLRGSTALFETSGNAAATAVVTQAVAALARVVHAHGGVVVKTLGDGLMAVFDAPAQAVDAADAMHASLANTPPLADPLPALELQVALAHGEVAELAGDCFGDAVNVAARLLAHAGDNETLATARVIDALAPGQRRHFRSLARIQLRGRAEPVAVYRLDVHGAGGGPVTTLFGGLHAAAEPAGIRLTWPGQSKVFGGADLPLVLGRNPQAACCIDDARVSRSHARIAWNGGAFELTDLSANGTSVRFGDAGETLSLRRGACTLHGRGTISLGAPAPAGPAPSIGFEILPTPPTAAGAARRVLYVEDNRINAILFEEALRLRSGIDLRLAEDGAEALELVGQWQPDLLVLDSHLPDMSGYELLRCLRELPALAAVPAVMCSADALEQDLQQARAAGFTGYWTKPIDLARVFADIDHLLPRPGGL